MTDRWEVGSERERAGMKETAGSMIGQLGEGVVNSV